MNATRWFTFVWTPWSLGVSIAAIGLAAVYCYWSWRRSGYMRSVGGLELLRLVLVAVGVFLFNQPEWVQEFRPAGKPVIAVLWDDSPSMTTRDAPATGSDERTSQTYQSRSEAIRSLTDPTAWQSVEERLEVIVQPFSSTTEVKRSDLHQPLSSALEDHPRLLAVVMASDGDWNSGSPPVQAATRLRLKGIPVYTVPVGQPVRLPDLELLSLDAPTFAVAGKSVRIPFVVDSSLPREHSAKVVLRTSKGEEIIEEVRIAPMARTSGSVVWKPAETGEFTLDLEVQAHPDETQHDNNRLTAPISIRQEKLKVLVVESYPRWEYRYLRNALSRDPGIEVSCLLFHPGLSKVGGGNKDYIQKFPEGLDELSQYDVVFLGDVGTDSGQLTAEQCRWLKGIVQHQASGLVFMPGWQGRQLSLLDTELGEVYPVIMDTGQTAGWGSRTPCHFQLTESGERSLLTKLADTEDENAAVWEGLPGFQWYAAVERAKPGTEVLCVHQEADNAYGRLPLLVTRTFGAGKVLFMGTDGAWRWRKGVEDKYHYRFWGQVVRWMAYQRNMAKGESMRLYYSPDQPRLDQTVSLSANVMDTGGEPLQRGTVTVRVVAPSGKADTIHMNSIGEEWGAYGGRYAAREPGRHELTLACRETGATLTTAFFVQGMAEERPGRPARPDVMEEIARVTQGEVLSAGRVADAVRTLGALPDPPPVMRRLQLWCHPVMGGGFILLLALFWVGRKVIGLI